MEKKTLYKSNELNNDSVSLRLEVFVNEQGIDRKEEITGDDYLFNHFYLYIGDVLVSYARARYIDDYCLIGRVVTKKEYRNKGYSSEVIRYIEQAALKDNVHLIKLHAQDVSLGFYLKLGYQVVSDQYYEAGVPHHNVEKRI